MKNTNLEARITLLKSKTEKLEKSIQHSADLLEVMNLQYMYAHLIGIDFPRIEKDYFAKDDNVTTEVCEGGIVKQHAPKGGNFTPPTPKTGFRGMGGIGTLGLNPTCTGYVVVSKNGKTARGMWDQFAPHSMEVTPYPCDERKMTQYWFIGRYNNKFIKENGKWKCLNQQVLAFIRTPYEQGWLKQPECRDQRFIPENIKHSEHSIENLLCVYHPDGVFYLLPAPPEPEE